MEPEAAPEAPSFWSGTPLAAAAAPSLSLLPGAASSSGMLGSDGRKWVAAATMRDGKREYRDERGYRQRNEETESDSGT